MTRAPATAERTPAPRGGRRLSHRMYRIGIGLTAAVVLGGGLIYWLTRPITLSPAEQVTLALELMDGGKHADAREIAERLKAQHYEHPDFAGVLEFILGMTAFGMIETESEPADRAEYEAAAANLREAERQQLDDNRRLEWCYVLGKCLYLIDERSAAQPLLEESWQHNPVAKADVAGMLIDLYLDPGIRTPELLTRSLELNSEVLALESLDALERNQARVQRSEILLAAERLDDAAQALDDPSAEAPSDIDQIQQARILLAHRQYDEALALLKPIALSDRLGPQDAARACFLTGLAAEALWDREWTAVSNGDVGAESAARRHSIVATEFFKRAADLHSGTQEATASNLHLGCLWRLAGSEENALQHYGAALRTLNSTSGAESFRNRWLSLSEFRQAILAAWAGWASADRFPEAIALSEMMVPLFPREEAFESAARAHQRWAESIENELEGQSFTIRKKRLAELQHRWRESAQAYERLAEVRLNSPKYPDALWDAADQYYRGHEFARSLDLINEFLATEPERLMAAALVQRSRIELDLDLMPEALADLQQVVLEFPTDPVRVSAQYLIGICHFEKNELDEAERVWRSILTSEQLSPSAVEWRDAQVALGRLLYERGELARREIVRRSATLEPEALIAAYQDAAKLWQEGGRLLSRYLERNPNGVRLDESRYYLGKSLQHEAEWLGLQYDAAETDNARTQLQRQHEALLEKALRQFELLRDHLIVLQNNDLADELQRKLLENSFFEIPHTLFDLRRYDDAIKEYNAAINRYPQDVRTLVAYLQMGQCHHRLGRKVEARNMLQQARLLLSLQQIPDAAFLDPATNLSRVEWEEWVDRARQVQ